MVPMDDEIIFKFKFEEDYDPKYVNGAYGGVNCRGEMMIHFFNERYPIPNSVSHEFIKGIPGKEKHRDPEEHIILRMIKTGVTMDMNSAKEFHRWLGEQIKLYDDANMKQQR